MRSCASPCRCTPYLQQYRAHYTIRVPRPANGSSGIVQGDRPRMAGQQGHTAAVLIPSAQSCRVCMVTCCCRCARLLPRAQPHQLFLHTHRSKSRCSMRPTSTASGVQPWAAAAAAAAAGPAAAAAAAACSRRARARAEYRPKCVLSCCTYAPISMHTCHARPGQAGTGFGLGQVRLTAGRCASKVGRRRIARVQCVNRCAPCNDQLQIQQPAAEGTATPTSRPTPPAAPAGATPRRRAHCGKTQQHPAPGTAAHIWGTNACVRVGIWWRAPGLQRGGR